MPYSDIWNVPPVVSWVAALSPSSVLDIGIGFGKYGLLLREALEIGRGRYRREDWQVRLEGVEVFERYRTPLWDYAYDSVHIGSAIEVLPRLGHYDVALICDVIEHFEKPVATKFLNDLLDHASAVIVTTPFLFWPQDEAFGNEAERHLSFFTPLDFRHLHTRTMVAGSCLLVMASKQPIPSSVGKAPSTSRAASVQFTRMAAFANAQAFLHKHLPPSLKGPIKRIVRLFR